MPNRLHAKWLAMALLGLYFHDAGALAADEQELLFPYSNVAYSQLSDYRTVAKYASRFYVKVTILAPSPARTGRTTVARNRTVSGASGVVLDRTGYVATAAHIARSRNLEAVVETLDGRKLPARIVYVDNSRDVALLKIQADGASLDIPTPAEARAGAPVLAVGTPDNQRGVVTVGRVMSPRLEKGVRYGEYGNPNPLQLNMHVEPGHSGGPVVNADGHLVGMIIGFDLRRNDDGELVSTGATYAVPAADLTELLNLVKAQSNRGEPVCFAQAFDSKCGAPRSDSPAADLAVSG